MDTHSRILAWRPPRAEEPLSLQSTGSQKNQTQLRDMITTTFIISTQSNFFFPFPHVFPYQRSSRVLGREWRTDRHGRSLKCITVQLGGLSKFSLCVCVIAQSCPSLQPHGLQPTAAPLSMEFSRQEYWSGLPFPSPGDLPIPGLEPWSPEIRQILHHLCYQGRPSLLYPLPKPAQESLLLQSFLLYTIPHYTGYI